MKMAAATSSLVLPSSSLFPPNPLTAHLQEPKITLFENSHLTGRTSKRSASFRVKAAKLPAGVEIPKAEPKFQASFLGFTRTAEIWNSRGTFIVELIINKGILQVIGVDVGKGLDLPL